MFHCVDDGSIVTLHAEKQNNCKLWVGFDDEATCESLALVLWAWAHLPIQPASQPQYHSVFSYHLLTHTLTLSHSHPPSFHLHIFTSMPNLLFIHGTMNGKKHTHNTDEIYIYILVGAIAWSTIAWRTESGNVNHRNATHTLHTNAKSEWASEWASYSILTAISYIDTALFNCSAL